MHRVPALSSCLSLSLSSLLCRRWSFAIIFCIKSTCEGSLAYLRRRRRLSPPPLSSRSACLPVRLLACQAAPEAGTLSLSTSLLKKGEADDGEMCKMQKQSCELEIIYSRLSITICIECIFSLHIQFSSSFSVVYASIRLGKRGKAQVVCRDAISLPRFFLPRLSAAIAEDRGHHDGCREKEMTASARTTTTTTTTSAAVQHCAV